MIFKACYDTEHGEVYCKFCAPNIEPDAMPQETDTFLWCSSCSRPLSCSLTDVGVKNAMEMLRDALNEWPKGAVVQPPTAGNYYNGCIAVAHLVDMAEDLSGYNLSPADAELVKRFLQTAASAQSK